MNYRKLFLSTIIVMAAFSSQVYAKELQAQVQKYTANTGDIYTQTNVAPVKSLQGA